MIELKGKYNKAKIFTDNMDENAKKQIIELLNQDFTKNTKIRIMTDVHSGAGCVIGFTANLGEKVIPNLVGVDIGCGVLLIELGKMDINLKQLDSTIYKYIPSGFNVHKNKITKYPKLKDLYCYNNLKNIERIEKSIGTLGSGNHFIEVNTDVNNNKYLVIHSGSRNLGHQVATFYQKLAIELCNKKENLQINYPNDLCYLTGQPKNKYLHDMRICQEYASLNRETIANIILEKIFNKNLNDYKYFHTIHNYINFNDNIIRKGSISAYKNEKVLIPINMKDGSILAIGKGNEEWNYSAPHGAGRLMSRKQAKKNLNMNEYKKNMKHVYTTSVNKSTLDEAPMAYKPMEEIVKNMSDTVEIIDIIKPIYNFKSN